MYKGIAGLECEIVGAPLASLRGTHSRSAVSDQSGGLGVTSAVMCFLMLPSALNRDRDECLRHRHRYQTKKQPLQTSRL